MPIIAISKMEAIPIIALSAIGLEGRARPVVMQRYLVVGDD